MDKNLSHKAGDMDTERQITILVNAYGQATDPARQRTILAELEIAREAQRTGYSIERLTEAAAAIAKAQGRKVQV